MDSRGAGSSGVGSIAGKLAPEKGEGWRAEREQEERGLEERWREKRWREDRRAVDEEDATAPPLLCFHHGLRFPLSLKNTSTTEVFFVHNKKRVRGGRVFAHNKKHVRGGNVC